MASVMRARALAQAASSTTSTRGPCAGPPGPTMPRSPWQAKVHVYTQFTACLHLTKSSLHTVYCRFTLCFHKFYFMFAHSFCKDPNGLISSTDTLFCVARVSQAIVSLVVQRAPGRSTMWQKLGISVPARPGAPVRSKIILHESRTVQITIFRCFLSFAVVV